MKKAWLITWESPNKRIKKGYNVVTLLNSRVSEKRVAETLEQLYVDFTYSPLERIFYAKNKKNNPYPVQYDMIKKILWRGRMYCGHNPFLYARQVQNIETKEDQDGDEYFKWEEIFKPEVSLIK